jgi:hypothetical protein
MSYKVFKHFIDETETGQIVDWVSGLDFSKGQPNHHLDEISQFLNGGSVMFDISQSIQTDYITRFQSISDVIKTGVPEFIIQLQTRISNQIGIPTEHGFLQAVDMYKGGHIQKHYDAAIDGYINYKCNISVLAEHYDFCIGEDTLTVQQGDLYCFEASLYKHWTPTAFNSRRVMLSFGFLLPYSVLGRDDNDVRVRLSKRIEKYFQK